MTTPKLARVIVVDDDEDAADLLAFALPRHGFEVTVAHTLAEAKALMCGEFDALVSDVHLPDGTGFDVLTEAPKRPRVAVIASGSFFLFRLVYALCTCMNGIGICH